MSKILFRTASSGTLMAALLVSAAVHAQVAGGMMEGGSSAAVAASNETDGGTHVGEIIVTARKRAENVQKVADPISVVTAATIAQGDVRTLEDAVRFSPNLVVIDGLYPGYKTVSFRGFTTLGRDGEFPFATVVDGVVQPGQMFFQQDLVNVQQIEVLRGPQGTLYGGGAIAGAINIVTKQPTDQLEGSLDFSYLNGPDYRFSGTLTGPLIKDVLYFQAGATAYSFAGLIHNIAANHNADFGQGDTTRGALIWQAATNLKVALSVSTTDSRVGGLWLAPVPDSQFNGSDTDPDENQLGIVDTVLRAYSLKVDYSIPNFATLTAITGYSRGRDYTTADGDFSPASVYTQNVHFVDRAYTEELRLTSIGGGPFKWNAGFYYQNENRDEITNYGSVGNPPDFFAQTNDSRLYVTEAVFGQASYDLTDRLTLTGGFRFDWEQQKLTDHIAGTIDQQSFKEPQGKATLSYELTPDLFTYASYSRGYRKGGFNPRSIAALLSYAPETADNYEVGFKSSFVDHKVTVNGAAFYTDFNGQQFSTSRVLPNQGIFIAISNVEKTQVLGAESEIAVHPFPGLNLQGSVGYVDDQIKKFLPEAPNEYYNNRIPQIYGFTAELGADYEIHLPREFGLIMHGDLSHRGNVYWDVQNSLDTSPTNFFNAKVSLAKNNWTLSFIGRNLTSERTPAAVGPHAYGTSSLVSYNEPRQYGVELGVKF